MLSKQQTNKMVLNMELEEKVASGRILDKKCELLYNLMTNKNRTRTYYV